MKKIRIIDADALKNNMFSCAAPEMVWDRDDIEHKIDEMSTVDAITIEWLLKKKVSCIHMSNRASQTAWLIGELIKEWQKENGGAYK